MDSRFRGKDECICSLDEHGGRVFQQLLHAHEEEHGVLPFDDAMVVREREVHHRADHDLAVEGHRALLDLVEAEDARLRRVEDGRGDERAEDAAVGDREGAAGEVIDRELAVARALGGGGECRG